MKNSIEPSVAILTVSTIILGCVTAFAGWTCFSLQQNIGELQTEVLDAAKTAAVVKELEVTRNRFIDRVRPAPETEANIRRALSSAGINPGEIVEVVVREEQDLPQQQFKRRDTRIRLNLVTLVQVSKACQNLRAACPAAGFAEAELSSGPPTRQSEPERWNARFVLTEFLYSAQ